MVSSLVYKRLLLQRTKTPIWTTSNIIRMCIFSHSNELMKLVFYILQQATYYQNTFPKNLSVATNYS